jgi:3-isopropylmalate dehydrogenase
MRILVMPCDGIGPEITAAAQRVLAAADARFALKLVFEHADVGLASLARHGTTLRDDVLERARAADGIVLGPQDNMRYPPREKGGRNVSSAFRVGLDLYANVRPARTRGALPANMRPGRTMDLVIMREATEGFYADRNMHAGAGEFMPTPEIARSLRKITAEGSARIARSAFELARRRRRKVTAVHKANCFHLTCGLFLSQVRDVARSYPDVELDDVIVDAMAAHLVRDPSRYDVVVTTNLFGDILSDLASELSGGLGLAGSTNENADHCCAQAQHGSAPDIAGKDAANPTSMILSVAMLLSWMGRKHGRAELAEAAWTIEAAVDATLADPASRTPDLGGSLGCAAFAEVVARRVAR